MSRTAAVAGAAVLASSLLLPAGVAWGARAPQPIHVPAVARPTRPVVSTVPPTVPISVPPDDPAVNFTGNCAFSHVAMDDPIVKPGQPGASHQHQFFGNRTTNAFSTYATMVGRPTSCRRTGETAAYWAPALYRNGVEITPVRASVYYKAGKLAPASIQPFPAGLMVVAGNHMATAPQGVEVVSWSCGDIEQGPTMNGPVPPTCPEGRNLKAHIRFPQCWDGRNLDSSDHKSHLAYPTRFGCPSSHPVPVPALQLNVVYPVWGDPSGLTLSSGSVNSMHADFFNTWDQPELTRLVRQCINPDRKCGPRD